MIKDSAHLTKENLKKLSGIVGNASYTLVYDNNDLPSQEEAGKRLWETEMIIAAIADHIFDYFPYNYVLNNDQQKLYPSFLERFKSNTKNVIDDAKRDVLPAFAQLETITRDKYNQHRLPQRNNEEEKAVLDFLDLLSKHAIAISILINQQKTVSDPNKPTADQIKKLIKDLTNIQDQLWQIATQAGDITKALQTQQFIEAFKLPLCFAWQGYKYGWHTDFCDEGESLVPFMMFEMEAESRTRELINVLSENSPFAQISPHLTGELIKVYNHFVKSIQDGSIKFI